MNTITIENALPRVFLEEAERPSDVWRCNLSISRGEMVNIKAESGTGKSSLCAYIYGSRRDYDGRILFDDRDISTLSINEWQEVRRRHLAYLPQEMSLFAELTALENIQLKNRLTGHLTDERIEHYLRRLGIDARTHYPVGKMSIGQQQRVGIIRAIAQPFDFLLLDEPVSHLDPHNNRIAAEILCEEASRQGAAIIATSVGTDLDFQPHRVLNL